jgi:hypothetical protein
MINMPCIPGPRIDIGRDGKACLRVGMDVLKSSVDVCEQPLQIEVGPDGKPCLAPAGVFGSFINLCDRGMPVEIGPDGQACLKVRSGIAASMIDACTPPLPIRVGPDGRPCFDFDRPGVAGSSIAPCGLGIGEGGGVVKSDQPSNPQDGPAPGARPTNADGEPYPSYIDPRTGKEVPFPEGKLERVPPTERVVWDNIERGKFIAEWYEKKYPTPEGGWGEVDIHHIRPREFGGTNDFWNLVPVERTFHQTRFTPWWSHFR